MTSAPTMPPLLAVLNGAHMSEPPLWLMRQAGRYLPEYRELRAEKGGFLALVYDSEAACEITIQPLRRFKMDGAILFSDILIVPHAMGQQLSFGAGEGPALAPPLADADFSALTPAPGYFDKIYETVAKVRSRIDPSVTMLGFAGSPWTIATYMVAGHGSKDQADARTLAYQDPQAFQALIDAIVRATVTYLSGQIRAGAQALQLFDSWAGSLSPAQFERWVIAPTASIVSQLKALHPEVPLIGFPKGAGAKLAAYARETGVDAIGLDETLDPDWANTTLPKNMPVQGNLDPLVLMAGGDAMATAVRRIRTAFASRPHIFNLGHGIGQHTPIANVEALVAMVRAPL